MGGDNAVSIEGLFIFAAASFIAAMALAAFLLWRAERVRGRILADLARAQERVQERSRAGETAAAEAALLRDERDGLALALEKERAEARGLERQIADLKEAKEQMRQAFAENAGALMKSHSESFKAQNREQIETLLTPLKEDIVRFRKSLGDAHEKSAEQHGSLKEQIAQLSRQSADMSKETVALTRALKGNVQRQGAWGEMIVDTILQRLGFREGQEFTRQETFSDGEGRVRTDFIVSLPNGERIVIDSKVSLLDFERYVNAEDDEERARHLAAHARSMRAHVKGLAAKEYHARAGSGLDFVIMFVPIEPALGAALQADETLSMDALDRKIAIATPTTLTTQLQTISALWKYERRDRNAEDIAKRAGLLYDKFVGFVGDLTRIGDSIRQIDGAYQGALGKLSTGNGNLVRQAEILKAMGASTGKFLPPGLVDAAIEGKDLLASREPPDRDEKRAIAVQ
jgi:DNA recombination protein RmuC